MAQKQISDLAFASGIAKDDEFVLRKVSDGTDYRITREESRSDLAANQGSSLVGDSSGATVHDLLPIHLQFATYADLRNFSYFGADIVQITGDGIAGIFKADPSDTTTSDNGGTVIVAADGTRWKRQYSVPTTGMFGSDLSALQSAISGGTIIIDTPCTLAGTLSGTYTAVFTENGQITVAAGATATWRAGIIAPGRQLFTVNGTLNCQFMPGFANPYWWGGTDLGDAINRAFATSKKELKLPTVDPNTGGISVISTPVQMHYSAHLIQDDIYQPITLQTGHTNPAIQHVSAGNCRLDLNIRGAATTTPQFAILLARNTNGDVTGGNQFNVKITGQFGFGCVYSIGSEVDDWSGSDIEFHGQGDAGYSHPITFITANNNYLNVSAYTALNTGYVSNTAIRINPRIIEYDDTAGNGNLLQIRDSTEDVDFAPHYAHYNGTGYAVSLSCVNQNLTNIKLDFRGRLETQGGSPAANSVSLCIVTDGSNGHYVDGLTIDGQFFLGTASNVTPPNFIQYGGTAYVQRLVIPPTLQFGNGQVPILLNNNTSHPLMGFDVHNNQGALINLNGQQVQDSTIHISGQLQNPATSSPYLRSSILSANITSFGP